VVNQRTPQQLCTLPLEREVKIMSFHIYVGDSCPIVVDSYKQMRATLREELGGALNQKELKKVINSPKKLQDYGIRVLERY
jgi:hypothetical protein